MDDDDSLASTLNRRFFVEKRSFDRCLNPPLYISPIYRLWFKVGKLLHVKDVRALPEDDPVRAAQHSLIGIPILPPRSRLLLIWVLTMTFIDATFTAYAIPVFAAYSKTLSDRAWVQAITLVATLFFIADIFVSFHSGIVVVWRGRALAVVNARQVAEYYVLRSSFFVDIIAASPILIRPFVSDDVFHDLQLLRLLRLGRLFKLPSVLRKIAMAPMARASNNKFLGLIIALAKNAITICLVFFYTSLTVNLLSCLWFGLTRNYNNDGSWLNDVKGEDLVDAPMAQQWVASTYFVVTTVTTVGYGDITATDTYEMVISCFLSLVGVAVFGAVIGTINQALFGRTSKEGRYDAGLREQMQVVDEYMKEYAIPQAKARRVKRFYSTLYPAGLAAQDTDMLFNTMPPPLRADLADHMLEPLLINEEVAPPELARACSAGDALLGYVELVDVGAWYDLYCEGDPADAVTLLQEGAVDLYRGNTLQHTVRAPALLACPASLMSDGDGAEHEHTARARRTCQAWKLPIGALRRAAREEPALLEALVQTYQGTLRSSPPINAARLAKRLSNRLKNLDGSGDQDGGDLDADLGDEAFALDDYMVLQAPLQRVSVTKDSKSKGASGRMGKEETAPAPPATTELADVGLKHDSAS